jgi:hypothetical protein
MTKINEELVQKLNDATEADNFEQVISNYDLDTPESYYHEKLCERDGVEVWGVSENGEVLVYDDGWWLLT